MGKIRKLKPWARWLDHDARAAHARHLRSLDFQVVDYTEGGLAIKMPVDLVPQWDAMPPETRAQFMADIDQQHLHGGPRADGYHDWQG